MSVFPLSLNNVEGLLHIFGINWLWSYVAALKEVGAADRQETGRWRNNRAEKSHLPFRRRERAKQRFRRRRSLQMFAAAHASIINNFNSERSFCSRANFKFFRRERDCCPIRVRIETA